MPLPWSSVSSADDVVEGVVWFVERTVVVALLEALASVSVEVMFCPEYVARLFVGTPVKYTSKEAVVLVVASLSGVDDTFDVEAAAAVAR